MKFPLVSRAHHDFVVGELRTQLAKAHSATDRAEQRLFDLLYSRDEAIATQKAVVRHEKDMRTSEIEKALDAHPRTKKAGPTRARLATWADREIEAGRSIEDVTEQLRTWGSVPENDDDDTIELS